MHFKAVLFDLDDTLYNEEQFVTSGFLAVANYLTTVNIEKKRRKEIVNYLNEQLALNGRGTVFNKTLQWLNLSEEQYLTTLIYVYRNHQPQKIKLEPSFKTLIEKLAEKKIQVGIVTDGTYVTQRNKTDILLKNLPIASIIHTDSLGLKNWKPSSEPFKVAANLMQQKPTSMVYIGDNPTKDFKGANSIGMSTIWWNPNKKNYSFDDDISKPTYTVHNIKTLKKIL